MARRTRGLLATVGYVVTGFALTAMAPSCGGAGKTFSVERAGDVTIAAADQDLRIAIVGKRVERNDAGIETSRQVTCIEPVGPALRLQNLSLTGTIDANGSSRFRLAGEGAGSAGDGGPQGSGAFGADSQQATHIQGGVGVELTQSLAQIYKVGEIMQLVHEMSFRYCEAYANGSMDAAAYERGMRELTRDAQNLLLVDMGLQAGAAYADVLAAEASWRTRAVNSRQACLQFVGPADGPSACESEQTFRAFLGKTHPAADSAQPRAALAVRPAVESADSERIVAGLRAAEQADRAALALHSDQSKLADVMRAFAPRLNVADAGGPDRG